MGGKNKARTRSARLSSNLDLEAKKKTRSEAAQSLAEYLHRNELTLERFAYRVGCSKSMIGMLCTGDAKPSLKLAGKIQTETQGAVAMLGWPWTDAIRELLEAAK